MLVAATSAFARVLFVDRSRFALNELLGRLPKNCNIQTFHFGNAGSKTGECSGEKQSIPAPHHFLCSVVPEEPFRLRNNRKNQQLHEPGCGMRESVSSDCVGFCGFKRKAFSHRAQLLAENM